MPSALAAFRLMNSSTFVTSWTGRSDRLFALEDPSGIDAGAPVRLREIASVAHQAARNGEVARLGDRRHGIANSQRSKLLAAVGEVGVGGEDESRRPQLRDGL